MAHFVLEHSANLSQSLELQTLFSKLHNCAVESGVFPLKGIRSRAYACENYRLADGNPDHGFVHLQILVGAGREHSVRENMAKAFFTILQDHLAKHFQQRGMAVSFELKELEPVLKYNKNNMQDFL